MVVCLKGTINGMLVTFERAEGMVWQAVIPSDIRGTYIVELTAFDEAGNSCYTSRYLLTYNTADLKCQLKKYPYVAQMKDNMYQARCRAIPYFGRLKPERYRAVVHVSDYYARLKGGIIC